MSGIFGWLINLFTGGVGEKVLDTVLNVIEKRVPDETERMKIQADVTAKWLDAQVQSSIVRKDAFGPLAKFFAAAFLIGPAIWWNAVFITSTFNLGWNILALPSAFYPWMATIISAIFFAPAVNNLTGFLKK